MGQNFLGSFIKEAIRLSKREIFEIAGASLGTAAAGAQLSDWVKGMRKKDYEPEELAILKSIEKILRKKKI